MSSPHKKLIRRIAVLLPLSILTTGCPLSPSASQPQLSVDEWSGGTVLHHYDGGAAQYELTEGIRTMQISASQPVDLFMVKMNPSLQAIPQEYTRYLVSPGRSAAPGDDALTPYLHQTPAALGEAPGPIPREYGPARDFTPPALPVLAGGRSASAAAPLSEPLRSAAPQSLARGSRRDIWTDLPKNSMGSRTDGLDLGLTSYTQRPATLQYVGTHCYVWVIDQFLATTSAGSQINQQTAERLGRKFDDMYPLIREVYGAEEDQIIASGSQGVSFVSSDTGTRVNIVVYDIEGDYASTQTSGVLGYFWAKDYYKADSWNAFKSQEIKMSNEGKYFYLDSGWLNKNESMMYSTLAHEFQHMIHFGTKTVASIRRQGAAIASSTWFTEMLSLLCEDMMQSHLGVPDSASPSSRLQEFCRNYYQTGITEWNNGAYVTTSYANAYAFGAYLARNYGGIELLRRISQNSAVDQEAITQGLRALGYNEDFDSVFRQYAQALVLSNRPAGARTLNTTVQTGRLSMKPIDIFSQRWSYYDSSYQLKTTLGPRLLSPTRGDGQVSLRPYGFTLHGIGYTTSRGTVSLTFSSPTNTSEKIYILVQPRTNEEGRK